MSNVQRVDDTDVSALSYAGEWRPMINPNDSSATLHTTNQTFANVTLSFFGTMVQAQGGTSSREMPITYTIDGETITQQMVIIPGHNRFANTLLDIENLDCSNHTVTIINEPDQAIFFDYFMFSPCLPGEAETPSALPSLGGDTGGDPPAISSSAPTSKPSFTPGVIAGISVAATVLVLALLAFFVFLRRRRPKRFPPWRKPIAPSAEYINSLSARADALFTPQSNFASDSSAAAAGAFRGETEKSGYNFGDRSSSSSLYSDEKDSKRDPPGTSRQPVEYLPEYHPRSPA